MFEFGQRTVAKATRRNHLMNSSLEISGFNSLVPNHLIEGNDGSPMIFRKAALVLSLSNRTFLPPKGRPNKRWKDSGLIGITPSLKTMSPVGVLTRLATHWANPLGTNVHSKSSRKLKP